MEDIVPVKEFSGLKIRLASPEDMLGWSKGEVTKSETINYRTFRPEKDGLFDERIFGPTKDYECYCGKYKRIRYKGIVCDRCGVEVTASVVRRERMGHITLAVPVAHVWYFKGASSPLALILDTSSQLLERIIYYALYLVKSVDDSKRGEAAENLEALRKTELDTLEQTFDAQKVKLAGQFDDQRAQIKKKITNGEQRDIAVAELELKEKEQFRAITEVYTEQKAQKVAFFDRLSKIVKSIKVNETMEEDDYLFLKDRDIEGFLEVGMGSEVIYDRLAAIDLKKLRNTLAEELQKVKGERHTRLMKAMRVVESFITSKIDPKWMLQTVLPVIPPDLRPVVQLSGGKFATSDLNDLYRRVINRNIRLKQLIELGAPDIILRNEKRMLQEAVDSLLDMQKSKGKARAENTSAKAPKSLSDILRGKQGRFRQNLLGKRVDYSGRSTIIVGPELKLNQCGIPKEMALELFKPYLLHEIIIRGLAPNIKGAKSFLEENPPVVYDILEEIVKDRPVLLNRAPTLHKLSMLAFYPVLIDEHAIKLHPTVCQGYNADFDGDAMGVFLPLSQESIAEVKSRMLPHHNLLKPADGSPIVLPNKEMALGVYYLTTLDQNKVKKGFNKAFSSIDEAVSASHLGKIQLRDPISVRVNGETLQTSAGRVIFNNVLPPELRFINTDVKFADLKAIIVRAMDMFDNETVGELIDRVKDLGFWAATKGGGLSISVFDCNIIENKDKVVDETEKQAQEVQENYNQGLLTLDEKRRLTNRLWFDTTQNLADQTWDSIAEENPVKIIINSGGARASREQLKQLSAIKGLMYDPMGRVMEVPAKSNYRQGLNVLEYIASARGARKGYTDSALKTADAGYLTRRLHDVSHDMIVRIDDCGAKDALEIDASEIRGDRLAERVAGRFAAQDIKNVKGEVIVAKDTLITEELVCKIKSEKVTSASVRSPLFCESKQGICQKCYGLDLSNGKVVDVGVPVGVLAAQSIGEPGTQLTMRVRHFGGIVISDVTQGLPRVEELFETRTPKIVSPIAEISGKVTVTEDKDKDIYSVKITSTGGEEQEFSIPLSQTLRVKDGDSVATGVALTEGHLDVKTVLNIKGLRAAQQYLVNEIQDVYESQGIGIHDKHFEVIVRKMSDKVVVEDEGDTGLVRDEIVSKLRFQDENNRVMAQGGRMATGKVMILGITRAAIYTDSWLSAASFEQTTSVLSQAALKGHVDPLLGLKENVIIGRLIPVSQELIDTYNSRKVQTYADNQPTGEESQTQD